MSVLPRVHRLLFYAMNSASWRYPYWCSARRSIVQSNHRCAMWSIPGKPAYMNQSSAACTPCVLTVCSQMLQQHPYLLNCPSCLQILPRTYSSIFWKVAWDLDPCSDSVASCHTRALSLFLCSSEIFFWRFNTSQVTRTLVVVYFYFASLW